MDSSFAMLELQITSGVNKKIPVKLSFAGLGAIANDLNQIIKNDLVLSTEFSPSIYSPDFSNVLFRAKNIKDVQLPNNADYIIFGKVEEKDGKYVIAIRLLDVYGTKELLLNKKFIMEDSKAQVRKLAHHISDLVYEKITKVPGIFSTKIAFVNRTVLPSKILKYKLMVSDVDGYKPHVLLESFEPIMSLNWSPNGRQLVYVSFENRKAEIYTITLSTGKRTLLTSFVGLNGAPCFSPDGNKLAIVLSKGGYPNIYVYDIYNRSLRRYTSGKSIDTEPVWSPDGKYLYFASDRVNGRLHLFKLDLASKDVSRVTFEGTYNASPRITADGQNLVFLHKNDQGFNLAVQNLHAKILKTITSSGQIENPSISPNGKMVIYTINRQAKKLLNIVDIHGQSTVSLPHTGGQMLKPAWGPLI